MVDLIDRQAAIDAVRKAKDKSEAHRMLIQMPSAQPECEDTISRSHFDERVRLAGGISEEELTDDFKDGVLTVLEMLRTEPPVTPKQPGWISCKTALPEHDGEYLVTKKTFGWNCREYIETDIARYEKKDGWHKADQVLAWMPLPTSYREGGQ